MLASRVNFLFFFSHLPPFSYYSLRSTSSLFPCSSQLCDSSQLRRSSRCAIEFGSVCRSLPSLLLPSLCNVSFLRSGWVLLLIVIFGSALFFSAAEGLIYSPRTYFTVDLTSLQPIKSFPLGCIFLFRSLFRLLFTVSIPVLITLRQGTMLCVRYIGILPTYLCMFHTWHRLVCSHACEIFKYTVSIPPPITLALLRQAPPTIPSVKYTCEACHGHSLRCHTVTVQQFKKEAVDPGPAFPSQ